MALQANREAAQPDADEQLLKLSDTHRYTGHGASWTWEAVKRGEFCAPIHIGKSARWLRSEVIDWQRKQIERSRGEG